MKLNYKLTSGLILLLVLMMPVVNVSCAVTWYSTDAEDDVMYFEDGIYQYTGDYRNEIDIVRVELDGSNLVIVLQDTPNGDQDHFYELYVYWHDWPFKIILVNYTHVEFGHGNNHVFTQLHYESGPTNTDDIYDGISITDNSIRCPVPLFDDIENTTADMYYCGTTYYVNEAEGDVYFDNISSTVTLETEVISSFTFPLAITSLVSIIILVIVKKKID